MGIMIFRQNETGHRESFDLSILKIGERRCDGMSREELFGHLSALHVQGIDSRMGVQDMCELFARHLARAVA